MSRKFWRGEGEKGAERRLAVAEERIETAALRDVAEQEPQQSDDGVPSSSRVPPTLKTALQRAADRRNYPLLPTEK